MENRFIEETRLCENPRVAKSMSFNKGTKSKKGKGEGNGYPSGDDGEDVRQRISSATQKAILKCRRITELT